MKKKIVRIVFAIFLFLLITITRAGILRDIYGMIIPNGIVAPAGGGKFENASGVSLNATMGQCFVGKTNSSTGALLINGRHYPLVPLSTNAGAILY